MSAISFALPLTCCTVFSQPAGMDSAVTQGFPFPPGLKHVGGGHVRGADRERRMEITWEAYATDQSVGEMVAFYQSKLGHQGMEGGAHGATWSFPVGAKHPERVLEVAASTKDGPWREGDRALLAKSKCVVMVSQASL